MLNLKNKSNRSVLLKKTSKPTDTIKLVVTSVESKGGWGKVTGAEQEVLAIMYKINSVQNYILQHRE